MHVHLFSALFTRHLRNTIFLYLLLKSILIWSVKQHAWINQILNNKNYHIRVRSAEVLVNGELFRDQAPHSPKVLRGGAGATETFVENTWQISFASACIRWIPTWKISILNCRCIPRSMLSPRRSKNIWFKGQNVTPPGFCLFDQIFSIDIPLLRSFSWTVMNFYLTH